MSKCYISIGSNLGNRRNNITEALRRMKEKGLNILSVSRIIETEPYGYKNQNNFLNLACLIETDFSPLELLNVLLSIEGEMSRVRIFKWGPRNIDLDIIFYENMVIDEKYLRIPHPDAHNRAFVLEPLSEISPGYIHPILKKTVRELLSELHKREINHKK